MMKRTNGRSTFFCGGLTLQEYRQIIPMARDENLKIWKVISLVLTFLFTGLLVLTFVAPHYFLVDKPTDIENVLQKYQIVYTVLVIFSFFLSFVLWVIAARRPKITMLTVLLAQTLLLIVFASVAPTIAKNTLSVTLIYCVLLFAASILTISNPFCNTFITIVAQCVFVILTCLRVDNHDILVDDLVYSNVFAMMSVIIGNYFNILRIKSLNLRYYIQQQRDIDSLTGAKSKTAYDKRVQHIIERLMQNASVEPFAVAVFDVNGLKLTNDTYGHEIGDELLIHSVELISDYFSKSEIYRTGGDEFVVILTGEDYDNRNEITKKFRLKISEVHDNSKSLLEDIPIACGLATYDPDNDFDYISVFSRADTIMYDDKRRIKQNNKYLKSYIRE